MRARADPLRQQTHARAGRAVLCWASRAMHAAADHHSPICASNCRTVLPHSCCMSSVLSLCLPAGVQRSNTDVCVCWCRESQQRDDLWQGQEAAWALACLPVLKNIPVAACQASRQAIAGMQGRTAASKVCRPSPRVTWHGPLDALASPASTQRSPERPKRLIQLSGTGLRCLAGACTHLPPQSAAAHTQKKQITSPAAA
jgi:hypothetical protein